MSPSSATAHPPMPLSEHGLAYHLASVRGDERKEILLDFAWTEQTLTNNYQVLNVSLSELSDMVSELFVTCLCDQ